MSEKPKSTIPSICERYPGIRMLHGCPMDEESYRRHVDAEQLCSSEPQESSDPFAAPQDFQAIAAQAQQSDDGTPPQASEEVAPSVDRHPITGDYWRQIPLRQDGTASYHTAGSYHTSGSYLLTSGSYTHWISSSGSFCAVQPPYGSDRRLLGGYGLHLI